MGTTLTCTISGDTETSCGDSDARVSIAARSNLSFEVETTAGATSRRVLFAWRATEPE